MTARCFDADACHRILGMPLPEFVAFEESCGPKDVPGGNSAKSKKIDGIFGRQGSRADVTVKIVWKPDGKKFVNVTSFDWV